MQPSEEIVRQKIYDVIPFFGGRWALSENEKAAKWLLLAATDILENVKPSETLARAFGHMENGETILSELIQKLQKGHRTKKWCH